MKRVNLKNNSDNDKIIIVDGNTVVLKAKSCTEFVCSDNYFESISLKLNNKNKSDNINYINNKIEDIDYSLWSLSKLRDQYQKISGKKPGKLKADSLIKYIKEHS